MRKRWIGSVDNMGLSSDEGTRLTDDIVRWTFVKLSRKTGLRGSGDSHSHNLHDF